MGRFSELDMLLGDLPTDREDPIYSRQGQQVTNHQRRVLEETTIWDLSPEEMIIAIGANSPSETYPALMSRVIAEDEKPKIYRK